MTKHTYAQLAAYYSEFELKKVDVSDNLFDNDNVHKDLKKKSNEAYKLLKEYEFKKRYKI